MAGCRKTISKLQQAHYKQYQLENRAVANRLKRLKKLYTVSANETVKAELERAINRAKFRRKTPVQSTWTNATKTALSIVKFFTGKGHKDLINQNKDLRALAWEALLQAKRKGKTPPEVSRKKIFSIGNNLNDNTLKLLEILKNNLKTI